jgi:threonine dehydrogenase-like Zn-dependent dehydrogenase
VIGVDSIRRRRELAREFGADETVDHSKTDAVEAIRRLTGGAGVDSAIEALGAAETFANCVRATRPGGTISNVGYHGHGDIVPIPRVDWGVGMADKTIRTGLCPGGGERMSRLLRFLERGRVEPAVMTTHRFAFSKIEAAFQMMAAKSDGIIKPLITF